MEAPLEQLFALVGALLFGLEAIDDHNESHSALHRRAYESVARLARKAGLEPIGADAHAQQRIAVRLADLVEGEVALAVIAVVVGIGRDDVARELGEFARGHQLARIGQSGRVSESGLGEAKFARPLDHHLGKLVLAAGDAFGEHDAGVVARLDDHAVKEVVDGSPRMDRHKHARRARRRPAPAPGVLADDEGIAWPEAALLDLVEHHLRRHQLGEARRGNQVVGILLEDDAAAVGFDQDRVRCKGLKAPVLLARARIGGRQGAARRAREHCSEGRPAQRPA